MSKQRALVAVGAADVRLLGKGELVNDQVEHTQTDAETDRDARRRRLVALARQVINHEYDQKSKELAQATGLSPQYVSSLLTGKIMVPSAENRRELARALHLRHVELLMLMGELEPDEIGPEGNPLQSDEDVDTHELLRLYRRVDDDQRSLIIQTLLNFVRAEQRRAAE